MSPQIKMKEGDKEGFLHIFPPIRFMIQNILCFTVLHAPVCRRCQNLPERMSRYDFELIDHLSR